MLKRTLAIGAAMMLAMAFLAACDEMDDVGTDGNGDDTDEVEETETPESDDGEETATPEDDEAEETATPDDEADETATPEEDEAEETVTPDDEDADETATPEDEAADESATPEDDEAEDDEDGAAAGDAIEVTLVDHEIEVDSPVEGGEVVFEVTNDGEALHGLAIERTAEGDGEDEDGEGEVEILGATTVESGETGELEIELEPGDYTLFCPVGEHREEEGMETELTVE